jgi:tetratricopeptide (TPR) repeat protein/transglutaminase-like putative cysteine protease
MAFRQHRNIRTLDSRQPRGRSARLLRGLALTAPLLVPTLAHAGDKPLYQPLPDWVLAAPFEQAASTDAGQPAQRIADSQTRIDHGTVWSYFDTALRIDNPETLTRAGTVSATWAPDHGDLIIHAITILRGDQRIDALASGARFQVLRREAELESLQLNGMLTATLLVEGLRVGDVLDVRMSVTRRDPVLAGHGNAVAPLVAQPDRLGFGRARVLWRDDDAIRWKSYLAGITPTESGHGGWHELLVTLPVAKQPDRAPGAPGRYHRPPMIELSDFADWAGVSRIMAPLYRTDVPGAAIKPGGELDQEVARIAAASTDPRRRTALALQLVQDKVRYFAVSMADGNLVPQTPEQTWSLRYGDCKAKTMLLLAILARLQIPAEAALANLENGDLVKVRLPSVMAFDHVMVLAHPGGATLWLDGTALGTREADLDDVGPYHWVLPLRADGADLLQAPARPPAHAMMEIHADLDLRAGFDQLVPITVHAQVRGARAGRINSLIAGLDAEARADALRELVNISTFKPILLRPEFTYDPVSGVATITAQGIAAPVWKRADSRYTFIPIPLGSSAYPDRTRTIWQDIPIALGLPEHKLITASVILPRHGEGIAMDGLGDETLDQPGAGSNVLHAGLKDGTFTFSISYLTDGGEFPAGAIPAMRRQDMDFTNRAPRLRTGPGYPAPWQGIEQARKDHLLDRPLAVIDRLIADKPDDATRLMIRAMYDISTLDYKTGIVDLGRVLALNRDKMVYRQRATFAMAIGDRKSALADASAALDLDPSDIASIGLDARLLAMAGDKDKALALADGALAGGGEQEPFGHAIRAEVLAETGDKVGALAEIDAGIEKRSGNATLLNLRCRLKGLLNTDLDAAVGDCTRAMQLNDQISAQSLQNRAMIHLRQHDLVQAAADLETALDLNPSSAEAYYLRALVRRAGGQADAAARDRAAARTLIPAIEDNFAHYGLGW